MGLSVGLGLHIAQRIQFAAEYQAYDISAL